MAADSPSDPIEPLDYVRIEADLMAFAECCETGWMQHLGRRLGLGEWLEDPELCGYCVREVQWQHLVYGCGVHLYRFDLKEKSVLQYRVLPETWDLKNVEILWPLRLLEGLAWKPEWRGDPNVI